MAAASVLLNSATLRPPRLQLMQYGFNLRANSFPQPPQNHVPWYPKLSSECNLKPLITSCNTRPLPPKANKTPPNLEHQADYSHVTFEILKRAAAAAAPIIVAAIMMVLSMSIGGTRVVGVKSALALSGGCMGGDSFSDSSSSGSASCDSDSDSYSRYSWRSIGSSSSTSGNCSQPASRTTEPISSCLFWVLIIIWIMFIFWLTNEEEKNQVRRYSVLKLQVGTNDVRANVQTFLNQVAQNANTSTSESWAHILRETVRCLCHYWDYCISGHSDVTEVEGQDRVKSCFKDISLRERAKFDADTLVNLNGIRKDTSKAYRATQNANKLTDNYLVITILIAARGEYKLPTIRGRGDLKKAVEILQSIPIYRIKAMQVLWAPQAENDSLSKQELLDKYPLLVPII